MNGWIENYVFPNQLTLHVAIKWHFNRENHLESWIKMIPESLDFKSVAIVRIETETTFGVHIKLKVPFYFYP